VNWRTGEWANGRTGSAASHARRLPETRNFLIRIRRVPHFWKPAWVAPPYVGSRCPDPLPAEGPFLRPAPESDVVRRARRRPRGPAREGVVVR